jgi:hypothetical protein
MSRRPDSEVVPTRTSLHLAAEHLLAATRKRATGEITLEPAPGGVRTPPLPDGQVVATDGADVVVSGPDGVRRARLTRLAGAAAAVGIEPGFPWTKHPPGTEYLPDVALTVDPVVAAEIAEWFRLGRESLDAWGVEVSAEQPSRPQIFPEHFDLGTTAGRVNYGFSPGDEAIAAPYVYVGPHDPLSDDPYWNAPFGAYRTWDEITSVEDALAFFREGRRVLGR